MLGKITKLIKTTTKVIFYVSLMMGPALWFGFYSKQVEMGLAIVASFTTAVILNFEKIKRFKAGSLEAEMQMAIDKAYTTIEDMTLITKCNIETLLYILAYEDRWGAIDKNIKNELVKNMRLIAEKLSIAGDSAVKKPMDLIINFEIYDCYAQFVDAAGRSKEALTSLIDAKSGRFPTREQIAEILSDSDCLSKPNVNELLDDYLYFAAHFHRRQK